MIAKFLAKAYGLQICRYFFILKQVVVFVVFVFAVVYYVVLG